MKLKTQIIFFITFMPVLLTGCCREIKAGQQLVNITPLYETNSELGNAQYLSDAIDMSVFGDYGIWKSHVFSDRIAGDGNVRVSMFLHNNAGEAEKGFFAECEHPLYGYSSEIIYGGDTGNQYCYSYIQEMRSSAESFCRPTGKYTSYAIFQKGRLNISLTSYSNVLDNSNLDEAILKISEAFK